MSEQPPHARDPGRPAGRSAAAAAARGGPGGVGGLRAPLRGVRGVRDRGRARAQPAPAGPPPPDALASAFGRPEGGRETLQRPPGSGDPGRDDDDALWSSDQNPWRDPGAGAVIGPPALDPGDAGDDDGDAAGAVGC
ncbi:hypothetical protein ACFQV2_04855 [Actinokineospora soli]|uniref:Uncharacterized protein n=1 Tax=Actinokineospora soli TaxID=1048753 RepID=A0ABW2TI05_9PSEU